MDKQKETFDTWNKMAELYEKKFMDLETYNSSYDAFCNNLSIKNARILDIGTGPGNIPKYMRSVLPDLKIEGIDIAPNMVERARKNIPNGKFRVLDSRDIHKLEGPYNGIVCGFCIPYLNPEETEQFITNVFQLLDDKGVFYLSFVEGNPEDSGFKTGASGGRVYFHYHPLKKVERDLKKAGFNDWTISRVPYDDMKKPDNMHTLLLIKK